MYLAAVGSRAAPSSTSTSSSSPVSSPKCSSSLPPLTRAGRPVSRCAAVRARSASAGSTVVGRGARLPLRAAVLGRPLGRAHGHALARDLLREPTAGVVVGQRQHGAGVALGDLAAGEHPEHVLGQLEQADAVRDGRLRAADALGHLAERELELVDQRRVRARLLDGARGSRARRSRRGRAAGCRGRRCCGRRPGSSAPPPRARRASGARRRSARSRRRVAAARRRAGGRPGAGSTPPGRRSPRARSGAAAAAGSGAPSRPGGGAARPGRLRRSAPRGRGRGRGGATH